MRCKPATSVVVPAASVADGVFAPGHLGGLTACVPFELVDAVLAETGTVQRRLRALPSRVGVYFLLTLGLFPHLGYAKVWSKLVAGLAGERAPAPSEKALRDLRRRLGPAPMKALFEVVAGPLAQPRTPGTRYRRWRTVAFDGCSSFKVPDVERNRGWLGRPRLRLGWGGYPTLRLMTLIETGSRGLMGAAFGPKTHGESHYARQLLRRLRPDMLVLADRGFDDGRLLTEIAETGAQFLVRLTSSRRLATIDRLPDGSYLTRIRTLTVRVIEADVRATCADGTTLREGYRLVTTLLDHDLDPAPVLVELYRERWEIETAYYALRHTLLQGRVLRSGDPHGIEQEMWALLTLYQVLRTVMVDAVESVPGTDPDRASFTIAVEAARDQVVGAREVLDSDDGLVGGIGRALLAHLLPARRPRISSRKVKAPLSRYARTQDGRPLASTDIRSVTITVHAVRPLTPAFVSRRHPYPCPPRPVVLRPPSYIERAFGFLKRHPGRPWSAKDLALALAVENVDSFRVVVARWAREGLIRRTHTGEYVLLDDAAYVPSEIPAPPAVDPELSRIEATLVVLRSQPGYAWRPDEIAPALGITNIESFRVQVAYWARQGLIGRSSRGRYTLRPTVRKAPLTCTVTA